MKYRSLFFLYAITFLFACKTIEPNKNEVRVERKNAAKAEKGKVNKDIADFLVSAADEYDGHETRKVGSAERNYI